ncbi:MAG: hypothetical protein ACK5M5_01865 [Limnobaculum xujianqingii]
MSVTKKGWLPTSLVLFFVVSGYTVAESPKNALNITDCDDEQHYINRSQQLYSFSEGLALARLNDTDGALNVIRFSLDKMKESCDINPYELNDELKVISSLLAKKQHYAEAQQLWEDALPLAQFEQFTANFLTSAAIYAQLADDPESTLRLVNTLLSGGENGVKLSPDLWQIDEKNNRLTDRLAQITYPLVNTQGWFITRMQPARTREDRTRLSYTLPMVKQDGILHFSKIAFEVFYTEPDDLKTTRQIKDTNRPLTQVQPANDKLEKNKPPVPFEINQLPDLIGNNLEQVKSIKILDNDALKIISANWKIKQDDWHILINAEFSESDSPLVLKALTGLFSEIKWNTAPKLYHQHTMKSIDDSLNTLYLSKTASSDKWKRASHLAKRGLSESAFPVEYEKFHNIIGINDYLHGNFADAWEAFQKSMSLHVYTNSELNEGYDYQAILAYAAQAARHLGKVQESSELISRYIRLKQEIKDGNWMIDSLHNQIEENTANGLIFPLIINEFNLENAEVNWLIYSSLNASGFVEIRIFPKEITLQQIILQHKDEAKRLGLDGKIKLQHTKRPMPDNKNKAVRWSATDLEPAQYQQDYTGNRIYWIIPYQGKQLILSYRSYQPEAADSEKLDTFAIALMAGK